MSIRKKALFVVLLISICIATSFCFMACQISQDDGNQNNSGSGSNVTHVHKYSSLWTYDEDYHWHKATCEHKDEKGSYAEHNFDKNLVCRTCGYDGKNVEPVNSDFVFKEWSNGYTVVNYVGSKMQVEVPSHHNGKEVIAIGTGFSDGFAYCDSIKRVILPNTVREINGDAFSECGNLTTVVISSSVTRIDSSAFIGCTSLTSIDVDGENMNYASQDGILYNKKKTEFIHIPRGISGAVVIPSSMPSIDDFAFYGCSSLTSIEIPSSVTSIGYRAFSNCSSLTSIEIPSSVTSIGSYAFEDCISLTSIVIPASVTSIGDSAFIGCSSLTSVVILGSATSIGSFAFEDCSSLTCIEISSGVTSIGDCAFKGCSSLTSILIPSSVTSIGSYAFYYCSSLTIYCEAGSKSSGWDSDWNREGRLVVWNCMECGITENGIKWGYTKDGVMTIAGYSGESNQAVIPDTINGRIVTQITDYAFDGCSSLENILIPSSVTSIGDSAFIGCSSLTIYCEAESQPSGWDSDWNSSRPVVWNCIECGITESGIKWGYTKDGVMTIAEYSGESTQVVIPDTINRHIVTQITDYAFDGCSNLESISIPSSVTSIGEYAFYYCSGLTIYCEAESQPSGWDSDWNRDNRPVVWNCMECGITENGIKWGYTKDRVMTIAGYSGESTQAVIPDTINGRIVTKITDYAFDGCSSMTSIEMPSSVTSIGDYAFRGCSNLTSIEMSTSVTSIGDRAFYGCSSLTSIVIPASVTSIGRYAFKDCSSLTIYCEARREQEWAFDWKPNDRPVVWGYNNITTNSDYDYVVHNNKVYLTRYIADKKDVVIPQKIDNKEVISIGTIFYYNTNITSIKIPSSVMSIGYCAFKGCSSLTSIEMPSSVTSIGSCAFEGCSSLTSIEIPSGVTSIGYNAFSGCSSLTSIEMPSSVTSIGSSAFSNCSSLTSIDIPSGVTSIGDSVFIYCSSLTSIDIPSGLTSIGSSAFSNCSSLTSIDIPSCVTSIGYYAFSGCSRLTGVYITDIASWCAIEFGNSSANPLYYAENLYLNNELVTDLIIPSSVTSIGFSAFYNCSRLTSIEIPSSVTSIGALAFSYCSSLTIYCEASRLPSGWDSDWNSSNRPVVWDYKNK